MTSNTAEKPRLVPESRPAYDVQEAAMAYTVTSPDSGSIRQMEINAFVAGAAHHRDHTPSGKGTPEFDAGYVAGLRDGQIDGAGQSSVMRMLGSIENRLMEIQGPTVNALHRTILKVGDKVDALSPKPTPYEECKAILRQQVTEDTAHMAKVLESREPYQPRPDHVATTDMYRATINQQAEEIEALRTSTEKLRRMLAVNMAERDELRAKCAVFETRLIDMTKIATGAA